MSMELSKFNQFMDSMDEQQLDLMFNKILAIKLRNQEREIKELKNEQEQLKEEVAINKLEQEKQIELERKRHYTTEDRYGYVSLNDLGQKFDVSIGSKTMGKLLRVVGLAKQKQSKTEPMRSAVVNDFAKSMLYGDFPTYQWNPEKCINKINKWLDSKGLIDEFYSIADEDKLKDYINSLADRYGI